MRCLTRATSWLLFAILLLLTACGPSQRGASPATTEAGATPGTSQAVQKTIIVGIKSDISGFSLMAGDTTAGGWQSAQEIVGQGLITSDRDSRDPVGRLAAKVPNLADGSLSILPDGRMKAVYPLRSGVTWQDGVPFTSSDLMFSFELAMDPGVPKPALSAISQMDSAEAPDDLTFVIYWKAPYYQADSVGLRAFWPVPRHLVEQPYRTLDRQGFANLSYWTSDFVHLGPFKVEEIRPGDAVVFTAYDNYFLGRPKVDRIIARIFGNENALYAATLAGAVDILVDSSLGAERGLELAETWERDGGGTVHIGNGSTRFIAPQFDPGLQHDTAILDPKVRAALLYAVDRPGLSNIMQHGHGELVANALLPPGDRLYDSVKDGLARYAYLPARARAILTDQGWTPGADGIMVSASGQKLSVPLWVTEGSENEIAAIADFWKQIGVLSDQNIIPGPLVRDREYRQAYSGVEISGAGAGDSILIRVDSRESTVPPNFFGNNRGHYASPRLDQLMDRYRASVNVADQGQSMKDLSDFFADELPVMPLYYGATTPAVRAGIKALDDYRGSADGAQIYGTVTRNAHEWDVL